MNQQEFLQECGESYPEAMAALGFYRQLVQRDCETVSKKRIQELCDVLGVSLQDLKWLEYAKPDKPSFVIPDEVALGCLAKRSENLYLYFCLSWPSEPDEDCTPVGIVIDIWIKDRKKRESLTAKQDQLVEDPAFADEPWLYESGADCINFWMDLNEGELPQIDEKLDQLFTYTINFLKSLKGIATYFRA